MPSTARNKIGPRWANFVLKDYKYLRNAEGSVPYDNKITTTIIKQTDYNAEILFFEKRGTIFEKLLTFAIIVI